MKKMTALFISGGILLILGCQKQRDNPSEYHIIHPLKLEQVTVTDSFWTPRLNQWREVTINDVLDKFEGKYMPDRRDLIEEKERWGRTRDGFLNFTRVANGKSNTGEHDGPPWYDGLIYETIQAAGDFLAAHPDSALEDRVDHYIDLIAAAQEAHSNHYINTYTELTQPDHQWGLNGGNDVWQHDIYNAGMLIAAAVHYYKGTGKTKLLKVAIALANNICQTIGPAPKINMVPGHGGPEEAILELYWLLKDHPDLKDQLHIGINPEQYYAMDQYWITDRGNHSDSDSTYERKSFGTYDQDSVSVFKMNTLEGHAVRATLLATGMAATALENKSREYVSTVNDYWNNMVGKRMFITGGEGAIHFEEKFGPDYYLPQSVYLETCAAVGASFFSQRMNQLMGKGIYMDVFERALYNNVLSGVALDGRHYYYENPLQAVDNRRWSWHSCPCCPPMFLKLVSLLPRYIYAYDQNGIYVNLFIGSSAAIALENGLKITVMQQTGYPWKGTSTITINPEKPKTFTVKVRVPGWAVGEENPFGLYHSQVSGKVEAWINGKAVTVTRQNGYFPIRRKWQKGDRVTIKLPVEPRLVFPGDSVDQLKGKVAIAAGPIVYAWEKIDNPNYKNLSVNKQVSLSSGYDPGLLGGINVITGETTATGTDGEETTEFRAVPFYSLANRSDSSSYEVWVNVQ